MIQKIKTKFWYIVGLIHFSIWFYIICPIKKVIHYLQGYYVPQNDRNEALLDYCYKVIETHGEYQPQTIYETWFDKMWEEEYIERSKIVIESGEWEPEEIPSYESLRYDYAMSTITDLNEYMYIKER